VNRKEKTKRKGMRNEDKLMMRNIRTVRRRKRMKRRER
jgi:hypothetical protein